MDLIGDRKFVEIPGDRKHELPPLLVRGTPAMKRMDKVVNMANEIVQSEELLSDNAYDDNAAELDISAARWRSPDLVERYLGFIAHWQWGDGILEWIRQCKPRSSSRLNYGQYCAPMCGRMRVVCRLRDASHRQGSSP